MVPSLRHFGKRHGLNSSIIEDKLSIAVNVCGLGLSLMGSIQTGDDCQWIFARLALVTGDLTALATTGQRIQVSDDRKIGG